MCTTKERNDPEATYLKIKISKIDKKHFVLVDDISDFIKHNQKLQCKQDLYDQSCEALLDEFKYPIQLLSEDFSESGQSSGSCSDSSGIRNM